MVEQSDLEGTKFEDKERILKLNNPVLKGGVAWKQSKTTEGEIGYTIT